MTRADRSDFIQPEGGYRFSADSLWLAGFVQTERSLKLADFGAGCGIVGLSVLEKGLAPVAKQIFLVEREPELSACLAENAKNRRHLFETELIILERDWRNLTLDDFGGYLDYIMVNPPYFPKAASRSGASALSNRARREENEGLSELCRAASSLLGPQGRLALVFPSARLAGLIEALLKFGLEPKRLQPVQTSRGKPPRLILAEAVKGGLRQLSFEETLHVAE